MPSRLQAGNHDLDRGDSNPPTTYMRSTNRPRDQVNRKARNDAETPSLGLFFVFQHSSFFAPPFAFFAALATNGHGRRT